MHSASNASANASSSLRPRTARLISGLDDDEGAGPAAPLTRIASPIPSPFDSRSASPIPSTRLSRPVSSQGRSHATGGSSFGLSGGRAQAQTNGPTWPRNESPTSLAGMWGSSWSVLQGMASELLSGDATTNIKDKPVRTRRQLSKLPSARTSSVPVGHWGPAAPTSHPATSSIGAGSQDGQLSALRAQKRKDMLMRPESSYADTLGRFKRRTSDDRASVSAPPGDNDDRDSLVYIHHVQKSDTLAGITIKYNCSSNVLRKANRMWPNDTVQSRQSLVLPVDACGVKGKPVSAPEVADLLASDVDALKAGLAEEVPPIPQLDAPHNDPHSRTRSTSGSTHAPSSIAGSTTESEQPWQHESWVLFPNTTAPTQIARLSRKTLGYFPPARRKSNTHSYSDLDTPTTSLDLLRTEHHPTSPLRGDTATTRGRRPSNATTGYFPTYLAGPGGVGTMNRNVHFPGPAQDGLNKMFAKHLPDVAPPKSQSALLAPEFPSYTDEEPTPFGSGLSTPALGKAHLTMENVGGAVEGWMRKLASRAQQGGGTAAERQRAARANVGGGSGVGDLFEMTDEFEIGGDVYDRDDGGERGRQGSVVMAGMGTSYLSQQGGARRREGSRRDDEGEGKRAKED